MSHYVSLINGMSNAQADDLMSLAADLFDGSSGVVAATDYAVAQSSPVAMSVTVGTGKAYIYISSLLSYYRTILDAAAVLSIASNSSGSDRIDLVCIKIDTGATPDADASNVATVVVVQGTPGAGAPSTPANHYKLAQVTVANGAVSIVTANIADSRSQVGVRSGVKVVEASLSLADNTTADASTTKHGLLKKLSNVATEFMNGVGNWVTISLSSDGWSLSAVTPTYSSVDNPTGIISFAADMTAILSLGMRIKFTNNGNTVYGIVTVVGAFSGGNTLVTYLHEIDTSSPLVAKYIMTNSAITNFYYSHSKAPYGFPTAIESWTFKFTDSSQRSQGSVTSGVWYNPGSLSMNIPIGKWRIQQQWWGRYSGGGNAYSALSTTNNSSATPQFQTVAVSAGVSFGQSPINKEANLTLTSKTTYYIVIETDASGGGTLYMDGAGVITTVEAICAYL